VIRLQCDDDGISKTIHAIKDGKIIIFPTDTIYGIGCDPYDYNAVKKIYQIKKRDMTKPLPILAGSIDDVLKIAELTKSSKRIIKKFWPGKLTLILKLKDHNLKESLNLTEDKIAIRIPNNPYLLQVLNECHFLVGTSANISGMDSFTDPTKYDDHTMTDVDVFLDGGKIPDSEYDQASTIIEIINDKVNIVRSGAISIDEIYNVLTGYDKSINLIITCARHLEHETIDEAKYILSELGDKSPTISMIDMPGILLVNTSVPSADFLQNIRYRLEEEPWSIRYMLKIIPIQKTIPTTLEDISKACEEYNQAMAEDETYRISVKKRNSSISSSDVITQVAKMIQRKVSLEKPVWEIIIEILGPKTGVSMIHSGDILSVDKLKREGSFISE
jgi:tRNA threonylcarbamoyl adenosine modification protein (Sua5/YciO/YrdC/YwlC family)